MSGVLDGKVALVTGASKGIGQVLAVGLAEHGAAVAVNYKTDADGAEETCRRIAASGGRAISMQADVGSSGEARRLVAETSEQLGRIDILVNNAARTRFGPVFEIDDDDFDDVVNTNLRGPFFASVALAESVGDEGGAIVNITSCAATLTIDFHSVYTMSKVGLEGLTRQLAFEFAPRVRVNAIAPAPTATERNLVYDPRYNETWGRVIPLGRVARPEDYIDPLVFLVSAQSRFLTGEVLHVDGGWTLKGHTPDLDTYDFDEERKRG